MTETSYAQALEAGRGGFERLLGLHFTDATPDRVEVTLEITEDLLQPYGILHGGVLCSIVETVGSCGAALWFGERGVVVGVANQTDFVRATRSGVLRAVGTPIHRGRTQQLWGIDVHDESGRLVARGQLRTANIEDVARFDGSPRE